MALPVYSTTLDGKKFTVAPSLATALEKTLALLAARLDTIEAKLTESQAGLPAIADKAFPFANRVADIQAAVKEAEAILAAAKPVKVSRISPTTLASTPPPASL